MNEPLSQGYGSKHIYFNIIMNIISDNHYTFKVSHFDRTLYDNWSVVAIIDDSTKFDNFFKIKNHFVIFLSQKAFKGNDKILTYVTKESYNVITK